MVGSSARGDIITGDRNRIGGVEINEVDGDITGQIATCEVGCQSRSHELSIHLGRTGCLFTLLLEQLIPVEVGYVLAVSTGELVAEDVPKAVR